MGKSGSKPAPKGTPVRSCNGMSTMQKNFKRNNLYTKWNKKKENGQTGSSSQEGYCNTITTLFNRELDNPWRKASWGNKDNLEEKLRNFELRISDKYVRILAVGEVGAGKSSFINSVNNVFQGRITSDALVDTTSGTSFTKAYKTHYIKGKDGSCLPFVFNDIMGLEPDESRGAHVQDVISALKGSLEEGHKFNPANPVSENDCKSNPSVDQTSCLVNVLAADKVSLMDQRVIQKMKKIREEASIMNLPQVIIMTKVDKACPLVGEDIRKVYTSKKIKDKMLECSNLLGVPMSNIFPVKNYHEEIDTDDDMDVLILKALDQIVNLGNDALTNQTSQLDEEAKACCFIKNSP